MSHLPRLLGAFLAVGVCVQAAGQRSSHEFEGHRFSLELPAGYSIQKDQSPRQGLKAFGFSTEVRPDGSRGLIQVSLLDFAAAPKGEKKVTLERFAEAMITGVSSRRSGWEQQESALKIAGVPGKRIAWSGSAEPGFGRPAVSMRGVMIVGIKNNVGFSLHTQDASGFADTTLPVGEQALHTFTLNVRR